MNARTNSQVFGLILGLVLPAIVILLTYFYKQEQYGTFSGFWYFYKGNQLLTQLLSLCVLPNLLLFFAFLQFKSEKSARGVLGATVVWAVLVMILKFV